MTSTPEPQELNRASVAALIDRAHLGQELAAVEAVTAYVTEAGEESAKFMALARELNRVEEAQSAAEVHLAFTLGMNLEYVRGLMARAQTANFPAQLLVFKLAPADDWATSLSPFIALVYQLHLVAELHAIFNRMFMILGPEVTGSWAAMELDLQPPGPSHGRLYRLLHTYNYPAPDGLRSRKSVRLQIARYMANPTTQQTLLELAVAMGAADKVRTIWEEYLAPED